MGSRREQIGDGSKANPDLDRTRRRIAWLVLVLFVILAAVALVLRPFRGPKSLLNVSYDGSRDFYRELNEAYARSDDAVPVEVSHAASTRQARAIVRGLQADVVSLATAADIDAISRETDLIATDWRTRLPFGSSPYTSTIVFLVRAGNPRGIADWQDLARTDVEVVSPSPRISGAGRWAYLAAWGYSLRKTGGDREAAERFVLGLYARSPVLDEGARGALTVFARRGEGDVLLTWENEAWRALDEYGATQVEVVYPSASVLAEPVVSLVDRYAEQRGTRAEATAYLEFLFSPEAQEIAARNHLRPRLAEVAEKYADRFPAIELFTVESVFGDWDRAWRAHFAPGGTFERIDRLEGLKRYGE